MACRSNRQGALRELRRFNPWISAGVLLEVSFIATAIHVPALRGFFGTAPFPGRLWLWVLMAPAVVFGLEELRKLLVRRRTP